MKSNISQELRISHKGSLTTITEFVLPNKQGKVKLEVLFESDWVQSGCYYTFRLYTKGYKCKNWVNQFKSENPLDPRVFEYVSNQQLYTAFHNHWNKLNPVRLFSQGRYNSELTSSQVQAITPDEIHKAY